MAVLNRKNAAGQDVLYFVCRTYQRSTKAGVCTCHCVKESAVTGAVTAEVLEVCEACLQPELLRSMAEAAVAQAQKAKAHQAESQTLRGKLDRLSVCLDQMYLDRLSGLLDAADFERLYQRLKSERSALEEKLMYLERSQEPPISIKDRAFELVRQFIGSAYTSREVLVSLIDRVELTAEKQVLIHFRIRKPET